MDLDERKKLLILALIFAALSVPIWYSTTYVDEGVFVYIGRHMSLAQMPYRDIPDNKGPAVYFFYRALYDIFGMNTVAWRLVFLLIILASGWAFYRILRRRVQADAALLGAALFWTAMLFDLDNSTGLVAFRVTETIGLFFLLWSLDLLQGLNEKATSRSGTKKANSGAWALLQNPTVLSAGAGLFFALAMLTNALCWPAVLAWAWLHYKKEIRITPAFVLAAGVPLAVFGLVLLATSSLPDYWAWAVAYNITNGAVFSSGGWGLILANLVLSAKQYLFAATALLPLLWKPARKHLPLAAAFLVLAIAPEIHQINHVTEHYEIMMVPTYILGFVAWYEACKGFDRQVIAGILIVFGLMLAAYFTFLNVGHMQEYADKRAFVAQISRQPELLNNSHVWVPQIGQSDIYDLTNSSYPGRHFFTFWLFHYIPWIRAEIVEEFAALDARGQVQYIVVGGMPLDKMKGEPACWEETHYLPEPIMQAIFDHYDCRPLNYSNTMDYPDSFGGNLTLCQRRPLAAGSG